MAPTGSGAPVRFLAVFALPFLGIGVFALGRAVIDFTRGNWKSALGLIAFGTVFSGAGIAIIVAATAGSRRTRLLATRQAAHPDQPWLWREDWARGEAKSSTRTPLLFISAFALFWNIIALAVTFAVLPQSERKPVTLLVLIFPLIGILLLVWAWRTWSRWRRFGDSTLYLTTTPGVIGGALAGVIHTERPLRTPQEIRLRIACIEQDTSGDSTNEMLLWEDEKVFTGDVIHEGGIPVLFNIPFECRPAETLSASRSIVWRVEASATVPGTDYAARFEVPVFKTPESRPDAAALPNPIARYEKPLALAPPRGVRMRVSPTGGTEFHFSAARNKSAALGLTAFTSVWIGAIVLMIKLKAPVGFPIVFSLFGALMLIGVLSLWTAASRVVAEASGLHLTRWYCAFSWKRFLPAEQVQGIESKIGMSAGTTTYYDLMATMAGGQKVKLASSIRGRKESEWLAREIRNALGRK